MFKKALFSASIAAMSSFTGLAVETATVTNAWVRETKLGRSTAAYLNFKNISDKAITLVAIGCSGFKLCEMHQTVSTNGNNHMEKLDRLIIPPKKTIKFKPGGKHIMMISAQSHLHPDKHIVIDLQFASGKSLKVPINIKKFSYLPEDL